MEFEDGKCLCGSVKVGARGQISIPKKARDYFEYNENEELLVIADKEIGITIIKVKSIDDLQKKLNMYSQEYGNKG